MRYFEIPLSGSAEKFTVNINNVDYQLVVRWAGQENFGWFLDINNTSGEAIVRGIPFTTGNDILKQYKYLFDFELYVYSNVTELPPGFTGLGNDIRLIYGIE